MRGRKKLFRVILATICTGSVMAFSGMSASAYALFPGKLEGGIYNRTYAIVQSVPFLDSAIQAFDDWNWVLNDKNNGQGVDFYFHRISGNESTIMLKAQIYICSIDNDRVLYTGLTQSYKDDTLLYPRPYKDFERSTITINEALTPTYNYFQEMRKIIGHEIGHAIGLAHNESDNGTLMYPAWDASTAYCPTLDDISGVRALYQ